MHMLTRADQEAFLGCVGEHLSGTGRFVVCLYFPHAGDLHTVREEQDWFSYLDEQGRTIRVSGAQAYDELRQVKTETAIRRIEGPQGVEGILRAALSLRYIFPQEMEALLDRCGFEIDARYGGPDGSPLSGDSRFMIFVCAK